MNNFEDKECVSYSYYLQAIYDKNRIHVLSILPDLVLLLLHENEWFITIIFISLDLNLCKSVKYLTSRPFLEEEIR